MHEETTVATMGVGVGRWGSPSGHGLSVVFF